MAVWEFENFEDRELSEIFKALNTLQELCGEDLLDDMWSEVKAELKRRGLDD